MVIAVINVDAHSFFSFLRPNLSPWGCRIWCFLVSLCCPIVKRPNLEKVTTRVFDQHLRGLCPQSCFRQCGYSRGLWVSFSPQMSSQRRALKLLQVNSVNSLTHLMLISHCVFWLALSGVHSILIELTIPLRHSFQISSW